MARMGIEASGRRSQRRPLLAGALLLLCLGGAALAFVGPSQRLRSSVPRRAEEDTKAKAPAKAPAAEEDPEDVAARTKGVFMSLDAEEFGLDSEDEGKIEPPREETWFDKAGDGAASLGAVAVFTVVLFGVTFYVFFTKQAEESFYYSGMRDRTSRFGPEEAGLDFREFDSTATKGTKDLQDSKEAQSVPNEEAPSPSP